MLLVILVCCCGLDEPFGSESNGQVIEFTSSKMRIITKAGDQVQRFAEGTAFSMFAVQSGTDWSSAGTKMYNMPGTGDSSGNIDYSIDDSGKKASYDVGKNLDFYGVTFGTSSGISASGAPGQSPMVSVALDAAGCFPDLMYSDNLKNKNSSSGLLNMEFRHALAKLKFEVMKQDESADNDKKLENAVLKKVVLKGSAGSAQFNVKTGGWSVADGALSDRVVYENSAGLNVETFAQFLKHGDNPLELLVVPNTGAMSLEVTLDVDGAGDEYGDVVIDYALTSAENVPLNVEANHEYTLSIVVLKNDVRIVTVTPKVYDWIDLDMGDVAYLGQPVYFGGLMWMDRNLGAKSADCQNDWYNSIGYYYQHGRNIPYIIDVQLHKSLSSNGFTHKGYGETDQDAVYDMRFIYTYDQYGNKIKTAKHANHSSGSCLYGNAAMNPGDEGDYSYIRGFIYKNSAGENKLNSKSWAKQNLDFIDSDDSKVVGSFDNHTYWHAIEKQPCPKGWRLPGKSDMYSFMPESTRLYWLDAYHDGDPLNKGVDTNNDGKITTDDANQANYASGNKNAAGESYKWKYFAGKLKVDPSADPSAEFSSPVSSGSYGRVYGIKYEGEDKAYRVMFEQKGSAAGSGKTFVRISRFQSESTDLFKISSDGKQWNLHKFDWSTPVEYMDIPLAGFLYESGISDYGAGTILRAVEGDGNGTNWTMYLRGGHNGVAVGGNSRRILGDQIRCVRDVNAK